MKTLLVFGIALVAFGITIQWINNSIDIDVLSGVLLMAGSFIIGRQTKK